MTSRYLFWAVVLGVLVMLVAQTVDRIVSKQPGYQRFVSKFGGST